MPAKLGALLVGILVGCSTLSGASLPEPVLSMQSPVAAAIEPPSAQSADWQVTLGKVKHIWKETGLYGFTFKDKPVAPTPKTPHQKAHNELILPYGLAQAVMIGICLILLYLAIFKEFEPLLLLPIGFGGLLSNIPLANIAGPPVLDTLGNIVEPGGFLYYIYSFGIETGIFPVFIFMGVGAMTDFGALIANPKTALLGAAAQLGIFMALLGALVLSYVAPGIDFNLPEAASIGIIGGADGPSAIWLTSKLAPDMLGAIAVAAYSYMALIPIIQPPLMRWLTTPADCVIRMRQLREVSKLEKVIFPLLVLLLCVLLLPASTPLLGALMLGNLAKECGVVNRLSDTMANALINIVTIMLGLGIGSKLSAGDFLTLETIGILLLGLFAFAFGTAGGLWMAKIMNRFLKEKINPLIGSAGVSAMPIASRVSNKIGLEYDGTNYLLMHAMGPNVAGGIGSAVVAGVLYTLCR